jgi:hypothetical protein
MTLTLNGKFEARPGLTIADDMATQLAKRTEPNPSLRVTVSTIHRRNSAPATNYLAVSGVLRGHITNFVELRRNAVRPASDLQNHRYSSHGHPLKGSAGRR